LKKKEKEKKDVKEKRLEIEVKEESLKDCLDKGQENDINFNRKENADLNENLKENIPKDIEEPNGAFLNSFNKIKDNTAEKDSVYENAVQTFKDPDILKLFESFLTK